MTTYRGLPELREAIEGAGWRIYQSQTLKGNVCNWYAVGPTLNSAIPNCACNDKPPVVVVQPYQFGHSECADRHARCDIELRGQLKPSGVWVSFVAYNIDPTRVLTDYSKFYNMLTAAWKAAAENDCED